jgi:hypothetical protein
MSGEMTDVKIRDLMRGVLEEFASGEKQRAEPAHKAELAEERRKREQLERRVNELVNENERTRKRAEETERHAQIRSELSRLGVSKVDLAFKVVRDDVVRFEDGRLGARTGGGEMGLREYLSGFVQENPEFLPARIPGGSGLKGPETSPTVGLGLHVELEKIRPGMSQADLQLARERISEVAQRSLRDE